MSKRSSIFLIVIVVSGFILRAAGLHFGLPTTTHTLATYHPDESIHLYSFEHINPGKLDFYPGDALYWGSFHFYLQGAVSALASRAGYLALGNREFLISHLAETDKLYVIGRMISVLFGTVSILVFYLLARKLYGIRGGIIGALLVAWAPLAVMTSFYAKPDGVMFFWYLCSLMFALAAADTQQNRFYVLYAACLGLAAASKYSGIISIGFFLPLILVMTIAGKRRLVVSFWKIIIVLAAALLVFIVVNPYAVIRFFDFWRYFSGMLSSKSALPPDITAGYKDYLLGILPAAIGWPAYVFAIAGMALLITGISIVEAVMLFFTVMYVLRLGPPRDQALTYCLPLVPFLLLFAVKFAVRISSTVPGKIVTALMLAYTLVYAASYKGLFLGPDTRELASRWIEKNIPLSAVIGISKSDFWTPPVLKEYKPRYNIVCGTSPQQPLADAIGMLPEVARRVDYIVLSSDEYYDYLRRAAEYPLENEILNNIMQKDFVEVAAFSKGIGLFGIPFYRYHVTLDWMIPNPTVKILKSRRSQ
jgi:hypothetical protein